MKRFESCISLLFLKQQFITLEFSQVMEGKTIPRLITGRPLRRTDHANELAKYEEGAVLSVSTVTYPAEKHTAKVSGINLVIDDNGMIHIEATLEPHPHLLPGMTAFVTIEFR